MVVLGFYHILTWRPSWSCDQDHLSKLSFPHPIEAPYEIWLWLAQWFLRRRCLKSVDDVRRTTEAYLPNEPSAQMSQQGVYFELLLNFFWTSVYYKRQNQLCLNLCCRFIINKSSRLAFAKLKFSQRFRFCFAINMPVYKLEVNILVRSFG